ncbi:MAG TPA: TlpA disulfide reductase family protein [Steroidobacteraceae bacterium]|nr:TlpA disulfide reductase family protein [Steroidobacteraceae bacterium]
MATLPLSRLLTLAALTLASGAAGFAAYQHWWAPEPVLRTVTRSELRAQGLPNPGVDPAADPDAASDATSNVASDAAPPARTVPATLPDIHLNDLSGKSHALKEYSGHPLIVNFWATWCAPCRREIPLLAELRASNAASRLEVLGIAVDFKDSVSEFLKKTPIDYPLLVGEDDGLDAAQKFGMELVLPFSVFADSSGRIVAVKVGELHREEATAILSAVRRLDAGTLSLPAARDQISQTLRKLAVERAQTPAT